MHKNPHPSYYRADIDGLRAIAVLAVVAFHAFPNSLKGGFVGVDIFFVISGYLISSIILKSLELGSFSFLDFYIRRINRIFPALALVLATCMTVGWFLLLPEEYKQLGKHTASGAGFISNFVLWKEAGYFDATAELKPLLHLWSLGIEEQFYIIWPALLFFAHRWRFNLLALTLMTATVSFILNIVNVADNAVLTFFLPQTRFWELLIGAILAHITINKDYRLDSLIIKLTASHPHFHFKSGVAFNNAKAWVGITLILVAMIGLNKNELFPGWLALLPTIGAFLLISSGPTAWFNRKILANRVLVFFGLISFPLYLWHWPLLYFARVIASEELTCLIRATVVLISFVLAWVTYILIEKRIRKQKNIATPSILVVLVIVIAITGYSIYYLNGLGFRFPKIIQNIATTPQDHSIEFRGGTCFLQPSQTAVEFGDACIDKATVNNDNLIFLWGDSHAAHLYSGLKQLQKVQSPTNHFRLAQFTASSCVPIPNLEVIGRPNCKTINDAVLVKIASYKPETVLLAAYWWGSGFKDIDTTIVALRKLGVKHIVIVGPVPQWKEALPKELFHYFEKDYLHRVPNRMTYGLELSVWETEKKLKQKCEELGVTYLSALDAFCNTDGCLTIAEDNEVTAFDVSHLTASGSIYLINKFSSDILNLK